MIIIQIQLKTQSQTKTFEAIDTYQKGDLFCIYCTDGHVYKYPIGDIYRVVEDYHPTKSKEQ